MFTIQLQQLQRTDEFMSYLEAEMVKRPASHRWAIGIFGFMTAGFVIFLYDVIIGRSGVSARPYWPRMLVLSVGALGLFSLVVGGRHRWAYYVTSAALATWTISAVYTASFYVCHIIRDGGPLSAQYFHITEGDQPFVTRQQMALPQQVLEVVGACLFAWLFIRFAFGRPSRSYYQLTSRTLPSSEPGTQ